MGATKHMTLKRTKLLKQSNKTGINNRRIKKKRLNIVRMKRYRITRKITEVGKLIKENGGGDQVEYGWNKFDKEV